MVIVWQMVANMHVGSSWHLLPLPRLLGFSLISLQHHHCVGRPRTVPGVAGNPFCLRATQLPLSFLFQFFSSPSPSTHLSFSEFSL